jgi:histidyl-tRNA synthetase
VTLFQAPKGAPDVLPPRSEVFERIIRVGEDLFKRYGYRRVETPAFEDTGVFERGLQEGSEIVTKQMYTFTDRGSRSLTLKPDATAPVVRAVIEHGLDRAGLPVKLYYTSPIFRQERPQAGRRRQFTQIGVEALGSPGPEIDAEVIELAAAVLKAAGLQAALALNSIGHPGCRSEYLPVLVEFLNAHREELSKDSQFRIDRNPLRVFDSKEETDLRVMAGAPLIGDYLCGSCADHFDAVKELLTSAGVEFVVQQTLVRGLDYYTRTAFEFTSIGLGSQDAVGGGGRYDGLSEALGGDPLPGIGFALGVDRIALALESLGPAGEPALDVYVATAADSQRRTALDAARRLREAGISADLDFMGRGLKAQLKAADRAGARWAVVLGEREAAEGKVTLRDMASGEQSEMELDKVAAMVKSR